MVALIFVRGTSDPLTGLVKKIDEQLAAVKVKTPRAAGVFLIVDSNADGLDKQLSAMAEKESLKKVNLCVGTPPDDYEISREAEVTVVIYNFNRRNKQAVLANFALRKGELTEEKTDAIVKALVDVLPK